MPTSHPGLGGSDPSTLVDVEKDFLNKMPPEIRKILTFAAYEANARRSPEIDLPHLRLGALRERQGAGDGEAAQKLREQIPMGADAGGKLALSEDAKRVLGSATTLESVLDAK